MLRSTLASDKLMQRLADLPDDFGIDDVPFEIIEALSDGWDFETLRAWWDTGHLDLREPIDLSLICAFYCDRDRFLPVSLFAHPTFAQHPDDDIQTAVQKLIDIGYWIPMEKDGQRGYKILRSRDDS